jgi:hypothetical protein
MYSNVFYIPHFNVIGGIETYIYELAKKYSKYDITVVYSYGDYKQIVRLSKYITYMLTNSNILGKLWMCNWFKLNCRIIAMYHHYVFFCFYIINNIRIIIDYKCITF